MSTDKQRLVVLLSGSGSNLQALINACQQDHLDVEIACVISNRPNAYGLTRAERAHIETAVLDHKGFTSRDEFDLELKHVIERHQPHWIVLAGFMRILTPAFVRHFQGKLINIHPSLLPEYPGLHTHQRVLDAGEAHHGASVHFVVPELDAGPVIVQGKLAIMPQDSAETLAARVLEIEHQIYPQAIALLVSGRAIYKESIAFLDGEPLPPNGYQKDYSE